jgi:hypothetical protein
LAFKRSLSAGILDGGSSEISLGGSRLNRFMKEVETVTGRICESEVVTRAEEIGTGVAADDTGHVENAKADAGIGAGGFSGSNKPAVPPGDPVADPWLALVQVGTQFFSALIAASNPEAPAHPWIERDPETGVRSLKVPLPPSETTRQLADALSAFADGLRGRTV